MWKYFIILMVVSCGCAERSESKKDEVLHGEDLESKAEGNIPTFDKLIEQFNNPRNEGRQHILYKLNELKYPDIKDLLETALSDENEYVRIIAIQSIKENMQVESIDELISMFKETENHTLVSNLTRTFVEFQLDKPISALVEKLNSKNEMIIYDCIWALGEIGRDSEIEALKQLTSNSNVPKIYDDNGILSQTTQFSIGEMAKKSIKKIKNK
jgi:HEAT repeat protein